MIYGAEVWDVNRKKRNKMLATEIEYLRRSCRRTRLGRIWNEIIGEMMEMERDIMQGVQK
jgi:hypothetical protein